MIGIYKITSPSGKVYIGQSVNIKKRWNNNYFKLKCSDQPQLFNSLKKYGFENHQFEIIEECFINQLDEKETFYKTQFIEQHGWKMALFYQLIDGKGGHKSEKTKQKISEANLGKKRNEIQKNNISKALKGRLHSEETKQLMSNSNKGISRNKGIKKSKKIINKIKESIKQPVLQYDLEGNFIKEWKGQIDVKEKLNLNINCCIKGKAKTAGGFIWRKKTNPIDKNFDLISYLIKKDKGKSKPMSEQHKLNIGKSLKGRKCTWITRIS